MKYGLAIAEGLNKYATDDSSQLPPRDHAKVEHIRAAGKDIIRNAIKWGTPAAALGDRIAALRNRSLMKKLEAKHGTPKSAKAKMSKALAIIELMNENEKRKTKYGVRAGLTAAGLSAASDVFRHIATWRIKRKQFDNPDTDTVGHA